MILGYGVGLVERLLPAPDIALVVDVVVDEGGAVDDLESGSHVYGLADVLSSAHLVSEYAQRGPEPLASGGYDVLAHLRQLVVLRLEVLHHEILHPGELIGYARVPLLGHRR